MIKGPGFHCIYWSLSSCDGKFTMLCQSQSRNKMLSFFIVFASTYLQPCIKCNPTVLVPTFVFLFIIYSQNLGTNSNTGVIINRLIVNTLMEIDWKWKWKCLLIFPQVHFSENGNICFVKLFQKSGLRSLLCGFPWKRESGLISIIL